MPGKYCRQRFRSEKHQYKAIKTVFGYPIVFLFVLPMLISGHGMTVVAADKYQNMINCDPHEGPCKKNLKVGCSVTLAVDPKPVKAMTDLKFRIILSGDLPAEIKPPYIDLGMPGMHMGPNRVMLKSVGSGVYEGTGIIVRCPSGRKIWQATVTVPDVGQAIFIFDVVY